MIEGMLKKETEAIKAYLHRSFDGVFSVVISEEYSRVKCSLFIQLQSASIPSRALFNFQKVMPREEWRILT